MAGPFDGLHVRVGGGLVDHVPKFSPGGLDAAADHDDGHRELAVPGLDGWVQFAVPG
jgi:hypothetical protein